MYVRVQGLPRVYIIIGQELITHAYHLATHSILDISAMLHVHHLHRLLQAQEAPAASLHVPAAYTLLTVPSISATIRARCRWASLTQL